MQKIGTFSYFENKHRLIVIPTWYKENFYQIFFNEIEYTVYYGGAYHETTSTRVHNCKLIMAKVDLSCVFNARSVYFDKHFCRHYY